MEYQDPVLDFARRTRKNLEFVERHVSHSDAEVYEVTQLINSMLGLLVFPKERLFKTLPDLPLSELAEQGWPKPEVLQGTPPCASLREIIRYLRNGIAHFNLEFTTGRREQINGIHLWNENTRDKNHPNRWEIWLSLEDLRLITNKFIDLIEDSVQPDHINRSSIHMENHTVHENKGITQENAAYQFARAWNRQDIQALGALLNQDTVYESQMVLSALRGRTEILDYLQGKFETLKTKPEYKAYAEIGLLDGARPCVILSQGNKNNLVALALFEVEGEWIKRIDLCIVPPPQSAKKTGIYPE